MIGVSVSKQTNKKSYEDKSAIEKLQEVLIMLRDKKYGCPWDVEQTLTSLIPHTIEEVYEVVDAIEKNDSEEMVDELGDLLFQVAFYAQIASEEKLFTFEDVANAIVKKLLRRHPHVFPTGEIASFGKQSNISSSQVSINWDLIKLSEKELKSGKHDNNSLRGTLDVLPRSLPALQRSVKLQKQAAKVGFDWPEISGVILKLKEEIAELEQAVNEQNKTKIEAELGDVIFTAINMSRHAEIDAEKALRAANARFEKRFSWVERELEKEEKLIKGETLQRLNQLWDKAKQSGL